jgi:hypothetical protein
MTHPGRHAVCLGLAVGLLAGCGGSQAGGPMPMGVTGNQAYAHKMSGSTGDLIYAATVNAIFVMSYPQGKVVAKIPGNYGNSTVCSDRNNGNVFVAKDVVGEVEEYAHGGTTPIATLKAPSGDTGLAGCAVDPTSGNLAVATYVPGGVLVWPNAQGTPTAYTDERIPFFSWPVYGNAGNLYLDGFYDTRRELFRIAELRAGHSTFTLIDYPRGVGPPGEFQWDGKHLVFTELEYSGYGDTLYRIKISGTRSKVVSTSHLRRSGEDRSIWLGDGLLFGISKNIRRNGDRAVAVWHYPSGGKPIARFFGLQNGNYGNLPNLTVSVAPPGPHIRK